MNSVDRLRLHGGIEKGLQNEHMISLHLVLHMDTEHVNVLSRTLEILPYTEPDVNMFCATREKVELDLIYSVTRTSPDTDNHRKLD